MLPVETENELPERASKKLVKSNMLSKKNDAIAQTSEKATEDIVEGESSKKNAKDVLVVGLFEKIASDVVLFRGSIIRGDVRY